MDIDLKTEVLGFGGKSQHSLEHEQYAFLESAESSEDWGDHSLLGLEGPLGNLPSQTQSASNGKSLTENALI